MDIEKNIRFYPGDIERKENMILEEAANLIMKRAPVSAQKILALRRPL